MKNCTFKPTIISKQSKAEKAQVHKRLYEKKNRDSGKYNAELEEKLANEMKECTFAPTIVKSKVVEVENNKVNKSVFDKSVIEN